MDGQAHSAEEEGHQEDGQEMSWLWKLNPEVRSVIAMVFAMALFSLYCLGVMLVRKLRGNPISGLPPKD